MNTSARRILLLRFGARVALGHHDPLVSFPGFPVTGPGVSPEEAIDEALWALCECTEAWADYLHAAASPDGFSRQMSQLDAADRATLGRAMAESGRGETWEKIIRDGAQFTAPIEEDDNNYPRHPVDGARWGNLPGEGQGIHRSEGT
jgi:hypothetical protein